METTTKTFDEFYNEAMEHYGKGEFALVYDLMTSGEAHYPDHAAEILYLRSCMAARMGDNTIAMDLIRKALNQGIWYGEVMMRRTPSWQDLQGLPEFEELVKANKVQEDATNPGPVLLLSEPEGGCSPDDPCPALIALHGNGDNGQRALEGWKPIVDQGWLLAAAQSSQAGMANFYVWDDQDTALRELAEHYAALRDKHSIDLDRVVLAGFSMGGETTLRAVLQGTIPVRAFILLGPGGPTIDTPDAWLPLIEGAKERGLRGYVFMGEKDDTIPHDAIRTIVASLNAHGIPCELEMVPDIAHQYPPNFAPLIERALAFIL